MFWIAQSIGLLTIVLTLLSFVQKEKWKMMVCLLLTNATLIASYVLVGNNLGIWLVAGALVRTLVYFYYNHINKKPEPLFMFLFEVYYIVVAILNWSDPVDLLMVINLIVVTYTSWQDNGKVLRFGYIFSSLLLIPYDIYYGLYTIAISEVVMFVQTIITLIKYANTTKTSYDIAQRYFNANEQFWGSSVVDKGEFDLVLSDSVDRTPFYNFGIIKTYDEQTLDTIFKIKKELKKLLHPRSVKNIMSEGKKLDDATLAGVNSYFAAYVFCIIVIYICISFEPFDFETNFTAALTCFNNVGPGFGGVGPASSFAQYSAISKIILSFAMLLGRLEVFPLLLGLNPLIWKKQK